MSKVDPNRVGDWLTSNSGKVVYPFDFDAHTMWNPVDTILHHSKECRFSGQCDGFYTVAKHCEIGARMFLRQNSRNQYLALAFCFHEAEETYFRDVPRPIKTSPMYAPIKEAAEKVREKIFDRLGIEMDSELVRSLKKMDHILLASEKEALHPFRHQEEPWVLSEPPDPWAVSEVRCHHHWSDVQEDFSRFILSIAETVVRDSENFSPKFVCGARYLLKEVWIP